jgi:nucleoside-diphosphate-sugar epimerase
MNILVTGARGFIGSVLLKHLSSAGDSVVGTTRQDIHFTQLHHMSRGISWINFNGAYIGRDLSRLLEQVDTVVHLAANAHSTPARKRQAQQEFITANCNQTLHLATHCAALGVRQFIFMSTIGVNGNCTEQAPFTESTPPSPHDAYSRSKHLAELELQRLSQKGSMQVICLRAPLVYGPHARGTFAALVSVIRKGLPLPLNRVSNQRSLLAVENLCDFIVRLTRRASSLSAHELFLLSDGEDVSTPTLIRRLAKAINASERLFSVHPSMLRFVASIPCVERILTSLTASLVIDSNRSRSVMNWTPPITMEQQLARLLTC